MQASPLEANPRRTTMMLAGLRISETNFHLHAGVSCPFVGGRKWLTGDIGLSAAFIGTVSYGCCTPDSMDMFGVGLFVRIESGTRRGPGCNLRSEVCIALIPESRNRLGGFGRI